MLTRKQHELLMFIFERIRETGVSPSFDEMKDALNLRSKSGIHRLITALEDRGFIRRLAHKARALEVVRLPDAAAPTARTRPAPSSSKGGFVPGIIEGGRTPASEAVEFGGDLSEIPVMGRIAAGTPIEALRNCTDTIAVPDGMLAGGEHYALEVKGDSMIEAGILNGDTVLIKACDTANNGEIVVALVDDAEATLKRLRKKGNSVALEAANPNYETRIYGPDRVNVQGKLVGLLRRY